MSKDEELQDQWSNCLLYSLTDYWAVGKEGQDRTGVSLNVLERVLELSVIRLSERLVVCWVEAGMLKWMAGLRFQVVEKLERAL
uniref:Uncharacterized protein n=1 Tax=Bursaphelenchus xylophilus TaxID=6326 RepID=A0A1I7RP84_BURXY